MPMDLLAQERIFGGEGTVDGKNIQFHVKTRVGLYRNGRWRHDEGNDVSSWYVRGRFLREKELGSVDRKHRTTG